MALLFTRKLRLFSLLAVVVLAQCCCCIFPVRWRMQYDSPDYQPRRVLQTAQENFLLVSRGDFNIVRFVK